MLFDSLTSAGQCPEQISVILRNLLNIDKTGNQMHHNTFYQQQFDSIIIKARCWRSEFQMKQKKKSIVML